MATKCRHCGLEVTPSRGGSWVHRASRLILCRPLAPASEHAEPEPAPS